MSGSPPITDVERPHLLAFGRELRRLRAVAGVGQAELARLVGLTPGHMWQLEHGRRRTRRTTIRALAVWLVPFEEWPDADGPSDDQYEEVVERLVELIGPALAAEKIPYDQRVAVKDGRVG